MESSATVPTAGKAGFPLVCLTAAVAVSAVSLLLIFYQSRGIYTASMEAHSEHYALLDTTNSLMVMNTRLTMISDLCATTGDPVYQREYDRLSLQLDAVIKSVGGLDKAADLSPLAAAINEANLQLAEIERRVFRLVKAGKRKEASALLSGDDYLRWKKTYSRGVAGLIGASETAHEVENSGLRSDILRGSLLSAAGAGLSLLLWAVAISRLLRWARSKGSKEVLVAQKDEEFRHFFNTVQEIFYRADWKGRLVDITPSIHRYSGYHRDELIGVPISNLYLNPEDRQKLIKEMLAKGIVEDYEVRLKTKDRGVLDVLVNARLLKGFAGLPIGIEGSLRDITNRKASERKLERMNRLYTILSRVNEALVRIRTRQKLFEEVCRIAVEAGGMKFAWVGLPGADGRIRPVAHYGKAEDYLRDLRISTDPSSPEGRGPTGTAARENRVVINTDTAGNPLVAPWREAMLARGFCSSAAFPITGGGVVSFYAADSGFFMEDEEKLLSSLGEDITYAMNSIDGELARKETESQLEHTRDQLRQSQKMEAVGRLAGGIAHDFNNMLTAILSYAGFLKSGLDPADPRLGDVQEIISAADKAANLTRQLLAFSRRQMLLPRIINLNDIAKGTEAMLRRLIGENVEFSLRLAGDIGNIKADPGQVEQVLMNLVVNARDAITGHGRIIVETAAITLTEDAPGRHDVVPPGRYVRLIISDTGSGMDQDTVSHMFEPFFTTKEQGKGTGLGLSTVYGIIKQSGGYVWVYSEPGSGTSFKIYFPEISEAEAPAVRDIEPGTVPGGTENILLAEDDAQVRGAMVRMLREAGYTVIEATNGEEAMSFGRETLGSVSLLITDLMMPKMGGMELAAAARALVPGLPVLYISGYSEELVTARGSIAESGFFVQKPVSSETLLRKVREAITAAPKK